MRNILARRVLTWEDPNTEDPETERDHDLIWRMLTRRMLSSIILRMGLA